MGTATYPAYERYKETHLEIAPKIPAHWQVWKVSHAFQKVGSGTTPDTGKAVFYGGGISWLQTGDLTDGSITSTNKTISPLALRKFSTLKVYPPGSLVMAMYGATIGKLGKLEISATTNQACCVFAESDVVTSDFAFYSLLAMRTYILADAYGGGQPNISQQVIKAFKLIVPPLPEQRAITKFLDEKCAGVDEAVRIKEQQIALLRERQQILIQHAVTRGLNPDTPMKDSGIDWIGQIPAHWAVQRNKHMFVEINERSAKGTEQHLSMSQKLGLVPANLVEKSLVSESYEGAKLVRVGDLVLNRLKAHLAVFSIAPMEGLVSPDYSVFRPFVDGASSQYYEALFKTSKYLGELRLRVRGIVEGFYRLYTDSFMDIPLLIPPQVEQGEIVAHLDQLASRFEAAISIKQDQIDTLKEYKTCLINAAVTGKIKVI
ncbi:restriction endonuclease subunit S [Pseudomonas abieticivorans]|uniref:restriction endonuclease subunit S n=1 Tax=Pseudomonas abieticivorans TaxID=2931382 RepID=UPI0020BDCAEE|nr:restriction endonuclease subunit S [Pseudomonas sp. PIA16]